MPFFTTFIHFLGGLHFLTENRGQHLYHYMIGKSAPRDYILFFRPYFKDNIKQTMQMEIDGNNNLINFFAPFPLIRSKLLFQNSIV